MSWIKNFDSVLVQLMKQIIQSSCELDQPIQWKDAKKICSQISYLSHELSQNVISKARVDIIIFCD